MSERLIDANALLEQLAIDETGIRKYLSTLNPSDCNNGYDIFVSTIQVGEIEKFRWAIEDAPTVERVKGEWEYLADNSTGKIFICTNCKMPYNPNKKDVEANRIDERPNYCSHCGSYNRHSMRGDEE